MKYIFYSLIILLTITGCSRKPNTYHKPSSKPTISPVSKKASPTQKTSTLKRIYAYYNHWKGVPYKYGGLSKNGIDCSGFVNQAYQQLFNIKLPRSTAYQVKKGKTVYLNQLRAGDLVFFKTGVNVRHVGIYLEKGKFAHASSNKGVTISSMYSGYWKKKYWQARRLF